ncbi:MAG: bifunctional diaminohydroxyphosphoribosylaminopyrimidine deaminase/5-amino-6-(5-phosphoribosylamino)uracil reductase RibD [Deltaproteobacteria bacterium]|nr:bifunctional diaminohydroxyphosphoribosylaminopyrimidine deaminase/5-amino-6-(5-phosphoribosylamino)uracil reductase RibD [Deltaproteobacteria bacterium]
MTATPEADRFYLGLALELARRAEGRTSPNPLVGAVVVRDGRIRGRGFHARAGEPHAEVVALAEAGDDARGADLYVTLEPCSHQGRTPPCVDRVVSSGVRRVIAAMEDPNPAVSGRGFTRLQEAGVEVLVGVREDEARRLNEAFRLSIRRGRAFVHLKLAATLDGRIATRSGDSRWVSSEESRARVHRLRNACQAILVGIGTVEADDPLLTVRLPDEPERRPLRVVLDPGLRVSADRALLSPGEAPHTLIACRSSAPPAAQERLRGRGVGVLSVPERPEGQLDLAALLKALYDRGIMEALVEGGGATARTFLDQGVVDRVHWFVSPRLLGGTDAVPALAGASPERMDEAWTLEGVEVERVGPDLYVTGVPVKGQSC